MKKILFLFLAVIGLSLTSCSTDEPIGGTETSIKKTSVAFTTETPSSTTGKQVKKPTSIPEWVNGFKVTATSKVYTNPLYSSFADFTFDQQNGADNIILDNVAVGANTFTAVTTTDSPQFYQLTSNTYSGNNAETRFDNAYAGISLEGGKSKPYLLYTGTIDKTISETTVNIVNIPMTSKYGRVLSVFQLSETLKNKEAYATVVVNVTSPTGAVQSLTATTRGNELVTFKFSNEFSVAGANVTYTVTLYNKNNVALKEYNNIKDIPVITIGALKNHVCFYTLNDNGVIYKLPTQGVTLEFPAFETVKCNTGDCR
jgi:hypothetical protein